VRRQGLFRLHQDQEGVTAIIVALCLIALFGMLVLVVDVGGLLWKRREMVSGSDAAALAAAKTCAVPAVTDPSDPKVQANTAAINNVGGLTASNMSGWTTSVGGCSTVVRTPSGYVTVQYSYPQQLFFAGIFGASTKTVTTAATAAWGPLGAGNAVPIVLESSQFQGPCKVPTITPPAPCNFWYDNGKAAIGDANWGFLSLDPSQWGVSPSDNNVCSNVGASTRKDWILHDSPTAMPLKDPGPTYVCNVTGNADSNWQDLTDRYQCPAGSTYSDGKVCPGDILLMPVNDCAKQVDRTGGIVLCGSGTPDKYAIIGFSSLQLTHVYKGNDPLAIGTLGTPSQTGDCGNNGKALGASGAGDPTLDLTRQFGGWDLPTFADISCGASKAADSITAPVTVQPPKMGDPPLVACTSVPVSSSDPAPTPAGCDYFYNPSTKMLSWWDSASKDVGDAVSFSWTVNGTPATPGACGIRAPDSNALCLVTTWLGYTDQNGTVGSGPSFGVQGHVLCDFTYGSCPAGINP
jgi:Flp pilus assembly protein TadG